MPEITNQEDEFYKELDKKSARRSCCTWQTFILFFIVLSIIASTVTIYLFYKIKQSSFSIERFYSEASSKDNFFAKLKINKDKNPTFSLIITGQELTSVMASGVGSITFEIKEIQVAIDTSEVILYGKLIKPLKADIKIETKPTVQDGKVFFEISRVSAGKLILPGFLNSEIEKSLNKMMDENFQKLYENYQVENISLEKNQIIISGKLKNM